MTASAKAPPVYTVGHSTHSIEAFVDLLRTGNVTQLVDVRTIPRSRTNPQYNLDTLPEMLGEFQIGHTIIPELGGRRNRQKNGPRGVNGFWTNQSFHNYADYAMSGSFQKGLEQLMALSAASTCAIMCSEAVWWRCHRRIIADYLLARGRTVLHLMSQGRIEPARMTPAAIPTADVLIYPEADSD